jgi:hypothetical protein
MIRSLHWKLCFSIFAIFIQKLIVTIIIKNVLLLFLEQTEPEPMTSMFGGLSIDNDDGGLLSLDQPEEIVEEEIKYETRSAVQPEPKLESEPNVVPASQPQIKLRKESYREPEPTYEDCLEDQFKRLKSSCERQGEKLWQQIQRNQDQHVNLFLFC